MVAASVDVEAMAAFPLGIIGELSSQCALSLTLLVFKILEYLASDRAHRQFITPQVVIRIDITERLSMIESEKFHDVRYSYRARWFHLLFLYQPAASHSHIKFLCHCVSLVSISISR